VALLIWVIMAFTCSALASVKSRSTVGWFRVQHRPAADRPGTGRVHRSLMIMMLVIPVLIMFLCLVGTNRKP
jgi:hypothetical protein